MLNAILPELVGYDQNDIGSHSSGRRASLTAIMYPDCEATSANGEFTLEARSPHNGTIDHRDGTRPSEDEFAFKYREHQSESSDIGLRLNDDGDLASRFFAPWRRLHPLDTVAGERRRLAATTPRLRRWLVHI